MGTLIGIVTAVLASYLVLLGALLIARPKGSLLGETLRLLPDLLRLIRRLASDRTLPAHVRVRLWLLLAYLTSPVDLVPDLVPVVGFADDAILAGVVLRSVVRRAGLQRVRHHWPGTEDGFGALARLTGLHPSHGTSSRDEPPEVGPSG